MNAEIITIGDEILIGQIIDTNSAFLGKELNKIGVSVYQITSIQDEKKHILKALKEAEENADIIIITGGLGPTKDDITKHTLCEYFDDSLVENKDVLNHVEFLFEKYINTTISDINRQQALVPSTCTVLKNEFGTAPGMLFDKNGKVFVSLPGVPYEMKALMNYKVLPELQKRFKLPYIQHKTLLTYGLGESVIADRIEEFEDSLPSFIKLAYLPSLGRVRLRLSGKSTGKLMLEAEMQKQVNLLLPFVKDIFVGYEEDLSIEALIGKQLTHMGKTLSVAESCTGGSIAHAITVNAGASKYFKGSVVSYASESKINILSVSEDEIKKHSVVSEQVAKSMAKGVLQLYDTDFAISTTGNAGPSKGDADAEVGTVWIGIATKDTVYAEVFKFSNHREKTVKKATNKAFEMLQKEILKK
ncbi:MAG: competence/damage-inducible protein A [Winogradskyella sp.]|uniref:competence/damage-inducible protein A n=1 Tax=Winogradskyella sp. TaxID=1883156 RepID=UPI0017E55A2F|nr:competence/damage-inducible protein A [Winogradskyella sp.]MBT8245333.1 competence/damage-inducible protein A [Winogradskyella sp.]NNK23582.1 competence/damage-inducible protein A [Winogradskyella sp.]